MVKKCEKFARVQEPHMPAVVEARSMLCDVPLDTARGETKGVWLLRASRLHGIPAALGKRLYYRSIKGMDADVFARMKRKNAEIASLNRRIDALKAAEQQHQESAHEIRRTLEGGSRHRLVAGGEAERRGDAVAEDRGVVPRQAD